MSLLLLLILNRINHTAFLDLRMDAVRRIIFKVVFVWINLILSVAWKIYIVIAFCSPKALAFI